MAAGSDRSNTPAVVVAVAITGLLSTVGASLLGGLLANASLKDQLDRERSNAVKDQRRQVYVEYLRAAEKTCTLAGKDTSSQQNLDKLNAAGLELLDQQARVLLIAGEDVRNAVKPFTKQIIEGDVAKDPHHPCVDFAVYDRLRTVFLDAAQPELEE
jgi:hypothetical protein